MKAVRVCTLCYKINQICRLENILNYCVRINLLFFGQVLISQEKDAFLLNDFYILVLHARTEKFKSF